MIVIRDLNQLKAQYELMISASIVASLLTLLEQRFKEFGEYEPYDPDSHGYAVIVEPGDTVDALEAETSCPILIDWMGKNHFGDADYSPAFEWLDDHPVCYEMGFVLSDSGFAVLLFIPKLTGIDVDLLNMCRKYS